MKVSLGFSPTLMQSIKYKFSKRYRDSVDEWVENTTQILNSKSVQEAKDE